MGDWKVTLPTGTTNLCTNPSFETNTTGWAAAGANTIAQSSVQSKWDLYSLLCTYQNNTTLATYAHTFTAAGTYTLTAWLYVPADWDGGNIDIREVNYAGSSRTVVTQWLSASSATATWLRIETQATIVGGDLVGSIDVVTSSGPTAGRTIYLDGVQIELQSSATTYCDGEQPGCEWAGAAHGSTSTRSALSRAGGLVQDFKDDYSFGVRAQLGTGNTPILLGLDEHALLPGGQLNSAKIKSRHFTLVGTVKGVEADCDLHQARQDLITVLSHDSYPKDKNGWQPVRIRYTGADVTKEIAATYEGGLEASLRLQNRIHERASVRFLADDPMWYEIGESSQLLDSNDGPTLRYVTGRLRSTGQWDDLGLTNNPTVGGDVRALCYASDGSVYVGGNFTGMNNVAGRDYIARYIPSTDTWETVGGASDFGNIVTSIVEGPDGTIYAGGQFINVAGVADADYIAQWDGNNWTAVGSPPGAGFAATAVRAMAFDSTGDLYIGGAFINWDGIANADGLVMWDGAAYNAVGAPDVQIGESVLAIAIDNQDNVYVGGDFLNLGGVAEADYLGFWNGSAWAAVGGVTPSTIVRALIFSSDDILYLGGDFVDLAGISAADYIAKWNGTAFSALGASVNNSVYNLVFGPDGTLFASGIFTAAGGITLADRVARWNGSTWAHLDVNLPGTPTVNAMTVGPADPVVGRNYDLYLGFSTTGAGSIAGTATVTNEGTAHVFPEIRVTRSGGTSATLEQIRNEDLGVELLFDYGLLDGETLTIDLTQKAKSITSSFFGARPDAVLKQSDLGEFSLQPGSNQVTCFVDTAGAPTVTAWMVWRDAYKSDD